MKRISVIIPNYNGMSTIGTCLEAVFSSTYGNFEVIVVDDCSTDNSVEIIKNFPCELVCLDRHSGASRARNAGAKRSRGDILFFIDADCILQKNTLLIVERTIAGNEHTIFGGTYTGLPFDDNFFSAFQSIFINYSETKKEEPDYIAAHAMAIDRGVFEKSGGFPDDFMPIIEDVEFSHRLRRSGYKLVMNPEILVRHVFNFTFLRSIRNAFRKSRYWIVYSLKNRDLLADSGTASVELKTNVASFFLISLPAPVFFFSGTPGFLMLSFPIILINLFVSRKLLKAFYNVKGITFAVAAALYYMAVYPLAVGAGSLAGVLTYLISFDRKS